VESEAIMASAAVPAADERPAAFVAFGLEPIAFFGMFLAPLPLKPFARAGDILLEGRPEFPATPLDLFPN